MNPLPVLQLWLSPRRCSAMHWLVLGSLLTVAFGCGRERQIPNADLTQADAAVAAKLDVARKDVLDNPRSANAWGRLGMVFNAHQFSGQALECYQHAARLEPNEFQWHYFSAVLQSQSEPSRAEEYFKRAIEIDSQYAPLYTVLAEALEQAGHAPKARTHCETALRIDSDNRAALIGLGEMDLQQGNLELSLQRLKQAARLQFKDHRVHELLAELYDRMGDQEMATIESNLAAAYPEVAPPKDEIRAAILQEAAGVDALARLGHWHLSRGNFSEAANVFRRVVQQRSGHVSDFVQLGQALAEQGKLDEAIEVLEQAMPFGDQDAKLISAYGLLLARKNQLDRASELFTRAIQLDPKLDISHFYSGMTLEKQAQPEKALVAYRRAVELNPANAAAHLYLGNLLAKQNDLDNSMVHWQLALAYDPNQDQALTAMADSNNRNEKHAANDALLRNAHERSPDNPAILVAYATHLAVCPDAELRNRSKAIQVAEHLLAVTGRKNVRSLVFLAAVVAEAGDFQRAISLLKEARAANAGGGNNPALAALIHADYRQYINKKTSHLSLSPETAPQTNSQ